MKKTLFAILTIIGFCACTDKEAVSKAMYDKAVMLEHGYSCKADAVRVYKEIIEKYPQTVAGKDASNRLSICNTNVTTIDEIANNAKFNGPAYLEYIKATAPEQYNDVLNEMFGKRLEFTGLLSNQFGEKKDCDNVDVQNKRIKLYNHGFGKYQSEFIRVTGGIASSFAKERFNIDVCYDNTDMSSFFDEYTVIKGGNFHVIGKYNLEKKCVEADAIDKMEGGEYQKK